MATPLVFLSLCWSPSAFESFPSRTAHNIACQWIFDDATEATIERKRKKAYTLLSVSTILEVVFVVVIFINLILVMWRINLFNSHTHCHRESTSPRYWHFLRVNLPTRSRFLLLSWQGYWHTWVPFVEWCVIRSSEATTSWCFRDWDGCSFGVPLQGDIHSVFWSSCLLQFSSVNPPLFRSDMGNKMASGDLPRGCLWIKNRNEIGRHLTLQVEIQQKVRFALAYTKLLLQFIQFADRDLDIGKQFHLSSRICPGRSSYPCPSLSCDQKWDAASKIPQIPETTPYRCP